MNIGDLHNAQALERFRQAPQINRSVLDREPCTVQPELTERPVPG